MMSMRRFGLRIQVRASIGALPVAGVLLIALIGGAFAAQAQGSADTRGAQLLAGVAQEGKRCAELSSEDLAAIGEFAMDRMAGSARAHETMNRYMRTRFGAGGETEIHAALGRRIAGCDGATPVGFAQVMGLTGRMGLRNVFGEPNDLGEHGAYGGPGAMMGRRGERSDDDEGPSAGALVGVMAVLIAALGLAVFLIRPSRRRQDPVETLRRRLANGDLSTEQYRERVRLLEGGPPA